MPEPVFGKLLLAASVVWLLVSCQSPEAKARQALLTEVLTPGVGLGQVKLGQTTLSQIETLLGPAGKRDVQTGQRTQCHGSADSCTTTDFETISLNYPDEGLWFEFEAPVPAAGPEPTVQRLGVACDKERCPFSGQTDRGLKLGATREQLVAAYGRPLRNVHNNWIVFYRQGLGAGFADKARSSSLIAGEDIIKSFQVLLPTSEHLH